MNKTSVAIGIALAVSISLPSLTTAKIKKPNLRARLINVCNKSSDCFFKSLSGVDHIVVVYDSSEAMAEDISTLVPMAKLYCTESHKVKKASKFHIVVEKETMTLDCASGTWTKGVETRVDSGPLAKAW